MAFSNSAIFFTGVGYAHDANIRLISADNADPTNGPYQVFVSVWLDDVAIHTSTETADDNPEISYSAGGNGGYSVPIPQDDAGDYKAGTYRVRFKVWNEDTAAFVDEQEYSTEYTPNVQENETITSDLDFVATYDCITGLITATDSTPMTGWNADTVGNWRTISLVPPATVDEPDPTPELDTSSVLEYGAVTFSFSYTNANYAVTLSIIRAKALDSTVITAGSGSIVFTQNEKIGKTIILTILCDTTLCDIAACYEEEFTTLETAACGGGGWGNLTARQKARLDYVIAMDTVRTLYSTTGCQNINKAAEYADKIKNFLDCGCGCEDTGQPTPYTAPSAGPW